MNSEDHEEVICACSGTTRGKVLQLIEDGVDNMDRISRITGACSGCGSCDYDINEMLTEAQAPQREAS